MQLALERQQQQQQQQQLAGRPVTSMVADGTAPNYYGGGRSNLARQPVGRASDIGAGSSTARTVSGAAISGAVTVEAVRSGWGQMGPTWPGGHPSLQQQQQQPTGDLL